MRPIPGMAFAAASLLVLAGQTVSAQSLTSVPDNAIVMVKVNNLEQTSKKLGDLFQQWGVAAMNPTFADPLVALEGMANLQQGLNRAGEGAFILVNPLAVAGGQGANPVIIMLPVSDYDAFLKNFPDAQADGDLTMITMPISNETGYVAKWGGFAAVSPNRALLTQQPKATKLTGLAAKEMQSRDIVAYVNFAGFRNTAAGGLSIGRGMVIGQVDQQMQQQPDKAKYAPLAAAAINQYFNGLDHVVNETQAMTIGVDLSKAGVQFTCMSEFVPDSYLAKLATGWKPQDSKLVSGLPDGKYVAAGGVVFDNNTLAQLTNDITGPIREEAVALGEDGKPFVGYIDAIKTTLAATNSQSFGLGAGEGEVGKSPLFEAVVVNRGDADKLTAAQRDVAQYQEQVLKLFQAVGQAQAATVFKPAAKSIGGVSFDRITTTVAGGRPNDPGTKLMETLYGPGGFSMLLGRLDPKTLLAISYKQDAQIQSAIAAAKAGTDPLANNAQVKEVASAMPQNPYFTMFVFPEQAMQLISRVSQAFSGTALQTKLPANVQPIAITGNTEGTAARFNLYLPSGVVKAGVQAVVSQAMPQNQPQRRPQQQAAPANQGL